MPPHPEVPAALRESCQERRFSAVQLLTDNLLEIQERQLRHGGIIDLFAKESALQR